MASPTLGGVTLTNATAADSGEIFHGKQERAHDGTLLTDYTALLQSWHVKCELLTEAQRDTIKAKTDLLTSQTFVDVDGSSYTVVVKRDTYKEYRLPAKSGVIYALEFDIEEAG